MREHPRDPWRRTRTGEQGDPLLPRWFAILAVVMVPVGLAVAVLAFLNAGRGEVPVAERRPAGEDSLTTAVGGFEAGAAAPRRFEAPCAVVDGMQVAGQERDLRTLESGLSALCERALRAEVVAPLRTFGNFAGVVRFAVFERTGVDSTARAPESGRVPVIYLNAKYSRTDPEWIAPLVAYEAVMLAGEADRAETVLRARRAELAVCRTLGLETRTPGCRDAAALLALPDPAAALGAAGYR
ncbi:MAG TPA: hypothetical protein VNU01_03825 [Egibacteraceae bacterium]|nr:hypothetical protein [Egibacteraceae bacterium]